MPDTPTRQRPRATPSQPIAASSASSGRWRYAPGNGDPRTALARTIPRRPGVSWWLGIVLALGFAALVTPAITAERWLLRFDVGSVTEKQPAPFTVRAPMTGYGNNRIGGGVVVARGEIATRDEAALADEVAAAMPRGPGLYLAFFALSFVLAALFTHHMRRSNKGRLLRVQIVSLALIAVLAALVKLAMLSTALSALVVPLAALAMVPTMALDRIVGLATGVLAALVLSLQAPFDIGLALLLLVQAAAAGLLVTEGSKRRWLPALTAGLVTTLCTGATYLLVSYLTSGHAPELGDPLHSPWLAAAIGPALAAVVTAPLIPIYQLLVGEITQGKLFALEDLGHPLLRQIAEKSPGTWQHSLMMANMAEIAANAIGASGRLVRVGAYFHDLGKSLQPKYFIENLEAGETSPHDLLPPEVSCDAIFAHVTEGIVTARRAGLHERIVDFMHMHHGNGVLEYFWARCREQGNPHGFTIDRFRYPGHPPQSRETALLAICDAVEAASRTLTKPDATAIDGLVQRIVYGKLHLGQLDESGLSMSDLRRISDSLRETIRHANHGRIEYPWQKAGQDASASAPAYSTTAPRLDSLDRQPRRESARHAEAPPRSEAVDEALGDADQDAALAVTDDVRGPATRRSGAEPPGAEAADAARIRPGTARNAAPGELTVRLEPRSEPVPDRHPEPVPDRRPEGARSAGMSTLPGRAPGPALPADEPSPGSDAGLARAFERSEVITPAMIGGDATRRDPAQTIPGRAPGPTAQPEPEPQPAAPPLPLPPSPFLIDEPASARAPLPPPGDRTPTAPPPTGARTPTAPPPTGARTPTAPPPASADRAAELARTAGPPGPIDLDSAVTHPPPRRPPATQAALPEDPVQLAAALASLVARVSDAPFGKPTSAEAAAVTQPSLAARPAGGDADAGTAALETAAPGAADPATGSGDAAPRDADADAAVTGPALATTSAPVPRANSPSGHPPPASVRDATGRDLTGGTPTSRDTTGRHITAREAIGLDSLRRDATGRHATGTTRTSGLGGDSRSALLQTLRGHIDETALRRPATDPAAPPPADSRGPDALARGIPAAHDLDAGVTEPSLPVLAVGDQRRIDLPLRPGEAADARPADARPADARPADARPAEARPAEARPGWGDGLAARIDAALSDEWGTETPIVAPTKAELRALLGQPDPTRQQPLDEIALLQRRAAELGESPAPRRSPHPTTEVDPDDIEAAIEVAPPARRPTHPNAIRATKPRKPE